jgi:hypothetical protein
MNRLLQRILACSFFLLTLLVSGKASLQATPVPNLLLDPTRPDTWAPEVKKVNDELRGLAQALISVAQDSDRPTKDRQKAILLLARIRNEEALAFLTSHVGIRLAPGAPKGAKEDVCKPRAWKHCSAFPATTGWWPRRFWIPSIRHGPTETLATSPRSSVKVWG